MCEIFLSATVRSSTNNCRCIHAGVGQHVQCVVTTVFTLTFTEIMFCSFFFHQTRASSARSSACYQKNTGRKCCASHFLTVYWPIIIVYNYFIILSSSARVASLLANLLIELRSAGGLQAFVRTGPFCSSLTHHFSELDNHRLSQTLILVLTG